MLDWPRRRPAGRIRGRGGWLGTKLVSRRTQLGAPGGAPVAGCCVQHTCEAPCSKRVAQWVADALPTKAGSAAELCPVGMSTPPRGRGPRGLRGEKPPRARGEPCAAAPRGLESPMEPADAREPNRSRAGGGTRSPPPRHINRAVLKFFFAKAHPPGAEQGVCPGGAPRGGSTQVPALAAGAAARGYWPRKQKPKNEPKWDNPPPLSRLGDFAWGDFARARGRSLCGGLRRLPPPLRRDPAAFFVCRSAPCLYRKPQWKKGNNKSEVGGMNLSGS